MFRPLCKAGEFADVLALTELGLFLDGIITSVKGSTIDLWEV